MKRTITAVSAAIVLAAAARAQSQVHSNVIYGDDGRMDVYQCADPKLKTLAESTVALFKADSLTPKDGEFALPTRTFADVFGVCPEEPYAQQPVGAFCSGSLVAPDVIMTAGHCVPSPEDCPSIKFVFGFALASAGAAPASVPAADVYGCKELIGREQNSTGADWALVRLDRKVAGREPLKLNLSGRIENGTPVLVIGHPSGLPTKIAGGANVRDASKDGFFTANLDTYGGNSGSAVFNGATGLVEGILVRGENDFVTDPAKGCRLSNRCPNDGCRGEDVTKISSVADKIPAAGAQERAAELQPRIAALLSGLGAE